MENCAVIQPYCIEVISVPLNADFKVMKKSICYIYLSENRCYKMEYKACYTVCVCVCVCNICQNANSNYVLIHLYIYSFTYSVNKHFLNGRRNAR